jgi:hypothetical protein
MGRDDASVTLREGDHLVRLAGHPVRWALPEQGIPDTDVFLGADNRDVAMDSRWWGALPAEAARGVVAFRLGAPGHAWRGWFDTTP